MNLDIHTAYLVAGLLYLVCPVTVWMVLRGHRSLGVGLWCLGGVLAGVGSFLIGLRGSVEPWLSFVAANAMLYSGVLLRQASLNRELGRKLQPGLYVLGWLVFMAAYLAVLQYTEGDRWRLLLVFVANGGVTAMNTLRAYQLAVTRSSGAARLTASVYGLLTMAFALRVIMLLLAQGEMTTFETSADQIAVFICAVLAIILGNFGFVGMVLEQVAANRLQAERDLVRAEERGLQSERRNLELDGLLKERELMLQRLAHSSRATALGMFASAIAHELAQPLGAIRINAEGASQCLRAGTCGQLDMTRLIEDIVADTQRAVDIVGRMRDLLVYGAVEVAQLDFREVVCDILSIVELQAARSNIRLEFEMVDEVAKVMGNRTQLQQVVLNLLANAFDAVREMPEGQRKVKVSISQTDQQIRLTVRDSGLGMDETRLAQAFQPFQTTKKGGMGVGLAISNSIVRNQGGEMRAENAPGGGAIFEVILPAAA